MKFSLSPSVTLVPGHYATFAITGLSCYHRRAFANNSSKDLYATDTIAPLCTDSHPNTIVTRRLAGCRSCRVCVKLPLLWSTFRIKSLAVLFPGGLGPVRSSLRSHFPAPRLSPAGRPRGYLLAEFLVSTPGGCVCLAAFTLPGPDFESASPEGSASSLPCVLTLQYIML
jgi:hypothetical protein